MAAQNALNYANKFLHFGDAARSIIAYIAINEMQSSKSAIAAYGVG